MSLNPKNFPECHFRPTFCNIFILYAKEYWRLSALYPYFGFPKGNNRQHEHLANAGKNINNPNKNAPIKP